MNLVKTFKSVGNRKKTVTRAISENMQPAAPATTAAAPAKPARNTVVIEAKVDVGFGNALYLRGEGQGLSWKQGIPLTCVDSSTWKWAGEANDKLKFKLLLNDAVWAAGEDLVAAPGEKLQISPAFN